MEMVIDLYTNICIHIIHIIYMYIVFNWEVL